jgi:tetratricopeptide (TPR) repeat protein
MDSAQSLAPYDVKVRSSLMNNCVSTGNTDAAAEHSRASVAANPNDANAYNSAIQLSYQVADNALASGNKAAMKPSLQHVISIDQRLEAQKKRIDVSKPWEGVPLVLNSEAQYAVARAYYLLGDYARSKETIEPLLDGKMPLPTDPGLRLWYAACLEKEGKVNEANIQLQQAVGVPNPQQLYDGILILSPIQ